MAYTSINFKTKKALKEAVANGDRVTVFQPGPFSDGKNLQEGDFSIEGPHYPQPHKWYARVHVANGAVTSVK